MKTKILRQSSLRLFAIGGAAFFLNACSTYEPVQSEAVTSAISFDDTRRFDTEIPDTSVLDTAFSEEMQETAFEALVTELERDGFDYVSGDDPELRMEFSTYVTDDDAYIDTTRPVVRRIVEEEGVQTSDGRFIPTDRRETITTAREAKPIFISGASRIFLLDVYDEETDALIWRGYTTSDDIGLDEEALAYQIERLVDELAEVDS